MSDQGKSLKDRANDCIENLSEVSRHLHFGAFVFLVLWFMSGIAGIGAANNQYDRGAVVTGFYTLSFSGWFFNLFLLFYISSYVIHGIAIMVELQNSIHDKSREPIEVVPVKKP